jgi:hypothetical protein
MKMYDLITLAEKAILILIAIFTIISVGIEMYTVIINGKISLTDLLLMFIPLPFRSLLRLQPCAALLFCKAKALVRSI